MTSNISGHADDFTPLSRILSPSDSHIESLSLLLSCFLLRHNLWVIYGFYAARRLLRTVCIDGKPLLAAIDSADTAHLEVQNLRNACSSVSSQVVR